MPAYTENLTGPSAPVRFDSDDDRTRLVAVFKMVRDQRVQLRETPDSFRQPSTGQDTALPILQLDVMMRLSPVIPEK